MCPGLPLTAGKLGSSPRWPTRRCGTRRWTTYARGFAGRRQRHPHPSSCSRLTGAGHARAGGAGAPGHLQHAASLLPTALDRRPQRACPVLYGGVSDRDVGVEDGGVVGAGAHSREQRGAELPDHRAQEQRGARPPSSGRTGRLCQLARKPAGGSPLQAPPPHTSPVPESL